MRVLCDRSRPKLARKGKGKEAKLSDGAASPWVGTRASTRATSSRTAASATSRHTSRRTSPSSAARTSTAGRRGTSATPSASVCANASKRIRLDQDRRQLPQDSPHRPRGQPSRSLHAGLGVQPAPDRQTARAGMTREHDVMSHDMHRGRKASAAEAGSMPTISRFASPC